MRVRLIISYDGTDYVGWQRQHNGASVQEVIEDCAQNLINGSVARDDSLYDVPRHERIVLHGSGRTDSGVHAKAQVAHFDTSSRIPAEKFSFALNALLPRDIRVMYSDEAPLDFHARFGAEKKSYRYTVQCGPHQDPFLRNTALFVHGGLDLDLLHLEALSVLGEHDFAAFRASGTVNKTTVRTIYESKWICGKNILHYDVTGNGFLYNMVRILAGTMLDVAMGRLLPGAVARALTSCDRKDAGATAPAHGLMLMRVQYPSFDTNDHVPVL